MDISDYTGGRSYTYSGMANKKDFSRTLYKGGMFMAVLFDDKKDSGIPDRIIYNGTTTICFFREKNGEYTKITSRPSKEDSFDKEFGVAMCIMKRLYGNRSAFQRAVQRGYDQNNKN